jgi:O-antigen/teichoic acid export membrane protein
MSGRIFIERNSGLEEVGFYALSYRLCEGVLMLSMAFKMAYAPFFYKTANGIDASEGKRILTVTNNTYIRGLLLMNIAVALLSYEILYFMVDTSYLKAFRLVPLISGAVFLNQFSALLGYSFYQEKKSGILSVLFMLTAGLNVVLNFLLVPRFGSYGAALATIFALAIGTILKYLVSKRYYFLEYDWGILLVILSGSVGVISIFTLAQTGYIPIVFVLKLILLCIVGGAVFWQEKKKLSRLSVPREAANEIA